MSKVVIIVAEVSDQFVDEVAGPAVEVAYVATGDVLTDVVVYACVDDLLSDIHNEECSLPVPITPDDPTAVPRPEGAEPYQPMQFAPKA